MNMKPLKLFVLIPFILLAFTLEDSKSVYLIPSGSVSVFSADLDLDNDIDIVVGSNVFPYTNWGGGVFLMNNGLGYYGLFDSIYFEFGYTGIEGELIDDNNNIDIFGRHQSSNPHKENIAIIYNYGISQFDSIKVFNLYDNSVVIDDYSSGDVDNDNDNDIVFTCNNDFFWGIIYNDGTGNFSEPEYFDLSFPPVDINCADLNGDGRSDVVVCGSNTEIYYWTESGFEQQILTTTTSHDVLLSDFDNDGDKDIITHRTLIYPTHRVFFFENLGDNQFFERPYFDFSPFCSYAQIADFNNDSLPDMVFVGFDDEGLYVYNNIGDFQLEFDQFIPTDAGAFLHELTCADFDNNNYNDLALIKGYYGITPSVLEIFFNDGMGGFQENPITKIQNPIINPDSNRDQNPIKIYPNPFNNNTTISILTDKNESKKIDIYDLQGKLIKTFIEKNITSGVHEFIWKGKDLNGKEVQQGIYLLRLESDRKVYTQRVVFVK